MRESGHTYIDISKYGRHIEWLLRLAICSDFWDRQTSLIMAWTSSRNVSLAWHWLAFTRRTGRRQSFRGVSLNRCLHVQNPSESKTTDKMRQVFLYLINGFAQNPSPEWLLFVRARDSSQPMLMTKAQPTRLFHVVLYPQHISQTAFDSFLAGGVRLKLCCVSSKWKLEPLICEACAWHFHVPGPKLVITFLSFLFCEETGDASGAPSL